MMNDSLTASGVIRVGSSNPAVPTVARVRTEAGSFVVTRCKMGGDDVEVWSNGEIGAEGFTLGFKNLPLFLKRHKKDASGKPMHPGYRAIQIHAPNAGAFYRVEG
jgi:hypothetical protein